MFHKLYIYNPSLNFRVVILYLRGIKSDCKKSPTYTYLNLCNSHTIAPIAFGPIWKYMRSVLKVFCASFMLFLFIYSLCIPGAGIVRCGISPLCFVAPFFNIIFYCDQNFSFCYMPSLLDIYGNVMACWNIQFGFNYSACVWNAVKYIIILYVRQGWSVEFCYNLRTINFEDLWLFL